MESVSFSYELLLILFIVAFVAGTVDTLVGGGGLITIPVLILSGLSPLLALGTNKVQAVFGSGTASYMMLKKKKVLWKDVKHLMLYAFTGSLIGTIVVQFIDVSVLSFIIPLSLGLIGIYFLVAPVPHEHLGVAKISLSTYQKTAVPAIGFYDGIFGPGTGSFFTLASVSLRGKGIIKATAVAKTLNFATNFASVFVFVIAGKVVWLVAVVMIVGQFLGARVGAHLLFIVNPRYLRLMVVTMCFAMLIKYGIDKEWLNILFS